MKNYWLDLNEKKKFVDNIFVNCTGFGYDVDISGIVCQNNTIQGGMIWQIDTITEVDNNMVEVIFTEDYTISTS